jgi:hypothetical protein
MGLAVIVQIHYLIAPVFRMVRNSVHGGITGIGIKHGFANFYYAPNA